MRRCPACAEQVQSAAVLCRFCGHRFAAADSWGTANDDTKRAIGWIGKLAVVLVLGWLAYACVDGAAKDQVHPHEVVVKS